MVLEITGNATVLQPRPPSNAQNNAIRPAVDKPGRTLKFPAASAESFACAADDKTSITKEVQDLKPVPKQATKLTENISLKILERFKAVGEAFLSFDIDRSGKISENEIKIGLKNLGFDLSDQALKDICSRFKHNEEGLIDYKAFGKYFADSLGDSGNSHVLQSRHYVDPRNSNPLSIKSQMKHDASTTKEAVDTLEMEIRTKLAEQFRTIRHAFLFFDEDRSGRIHMDEFARVLQRYGIILSEAEMAELKFRTDSERAAAELIMPARKKRDAIFSSYEAEDDDAAIAAKAAKEEKMISGIKYEDFVQHIGSVLQPADDNNNGENFHHQVGKKSKGQKNVGHTASHKIFGSKTTATEGKKAQKLLATRIFSSLDELHDALVFYDRSVAEVLAPSQFVDVLTRYGAKKETSLAVAEKYTVQVEGTDMKHINYPNFFAVLSNVAGDAFSTFFAEENIVLQIDFKENMRQKAISTSLVHKIALELAEREGLARVIATWKLFDRAGSGKIQGGEFINALRNMRSGGTMPQRGATALAELYDLDGTGRCDYVAFSRSFRKDMVATASRISKTAAMRKGSLLVNTARKATDFWESHATNAKNEAEKAQVLLLDTRQITKPTLLLPDQKICQLATEKKKSPRFRASFDTHNLVKKFRTELAPHWKTLSKLFKSHDKKNTGYVSPSRFAKIILSRTSAIPKLQLERLALAFVDFSKKENKPMISYNRFMRMLVLEPMRPQANGRSRRPMTRPTPTKIVLSTPSARPTTSADTGVQREAARVEDGAKTFSGISQPCSFSIYGRWKELRRMFAKADTKRTGKVLTSFFCETLQKHAFAVTQEDYSSIRFQFGSNGAIRYHDFLRYVLTQVVKSKSNC